MLPVLSGTAIVLMMMVACALFMLSAVWAFLKLRELKRKHRK